MRYAIARSATFYPRCFNPKASRCSSAEMKLAAPKGQQQRLLLGQRDFLVRLELGGYVTRIRAPAYSAAQRASGVRASGFKTAHSRRKRHEHRLVHPCGSQRCVRLEELRMLPEIAARLVRRVAPTAQRPRLSGQCSGATLCRPRGFPPAEPEAPCFCNKSRSHCRRTRRRALDLLLAATREFPRAAASEPG